MYAPFILPFIFLVAGVIFHKFTGITLSIFLPAVLFFVSVLFRGITGYILFLISIFLTGIFISEVSELKPFKRNGAFISCEISSVPKYMRSRIYFRCRVSDSDIRSIKGEQINVVLKTEDPFSEDIFYSYRISFLGFLVSDGKRITAYPTDGFLKVESRGGIISYIWDFKRFSVMSFREKTGDDELFSLGLALIFGEKGFLDRDIKNIFIDSGLTHLLAISGLHIAVIVSILFFIFSFLGKRAVYTVSAFVLSIYPLFTGLHIPVLRASIMGLMYILSKLRYIEINSMNILFFVAFIVVLISPYSIFSPSFQLSFIAVFGILISLRYIVFEGKNRYWSVVYSAFMISLIAVLFTMPVVIYHFGKFSPVSVISTPAGMIFLYPYLFFSVINLFTFFSIEPFIYIMNISGKLFIKTAEIFDSFDLFSSGYSPSFLSVFLYTALLSALILVRMNIYKKLISVIILIFVFLNISKTDIVGYRVYSFKGVKRPDIILITDDRRCFVYWKNERYRINILMDRYACRKRYLFVQRNRYFDGFDDYITPSDEKDGVYLKEYKTGLFIRFKDISFFIRNRDVVYNFQ